MSPDDPRHGAMRGFKAGCREMCCRRAYARYQKRYRLNKERGITLAIPAIGTQRRIQALMALGWTTSDIAHAGGWTHRNRVRQILGGQKGRPTRWLERSTHETIARIYSEWCMSIPEQTEPRRRSRARALRLGYLPPLAWDDIDDPDESPADEGYSPATRADLIAGYVERGDNLTATTRALGIDKNALQTWCRRNGMRDEYLILATREGFWNQPGTDVA